MKKIFHMVLFIYLLVKSWEILSFFTQQESKLWPQLQAKMTKELLAKS